MLQLAINNRNETIDLDRSRITIGREGDNTVVLNANDVSGYHAEIHCEPGGVHVVDLGSTNGTFVNGKRINVRQKLAAWDRVAFGSVQAELIDASGRRPTRVLGSRGQARSSAGHKSWRLVGQRDAFEISARHAIGRDPGCDLTVSSDSISRRHAQLELREGQLVVTDLGSANGTFVNGQRVRERVLEVGDEVRFDRESFRVEGPADPGRASVRPPAAAATRVRRDLSDAGATVVSNGPSRLEVVAGMAAKSFGLSKAKYLVGRSAENDIQLPEGSVSSRHAQLEKFGGGWRLTDLQSTNGTFVNGRRIHSVELKPGDRIRFGDVRVDYPHHVPQSAPRSGGPAIPDKTAMPDRSATTATPHLPQQPPRPIGKAMPVRAKTRSARPASGFPAWGYAIAALLLLSMGVGVFLVSQQDSLNSTLRVERLLKSGSGDGGGVIRKAALGERESFSTQEERRSDNIVSSLRKQLFERLVGKHDLRCFDHNGDWQTVYMSKLQAGHKVDLSAPPCEVKERYPRESGCGGALPTGVCYEEDITYRGQVSTSASPLYVFNVKDRYGKPSVNHTMFLRPNGSVVADVYSGNMSTGLYMLGDGRIPKKPIALGGSYFPTHGRLLYNEQEVDSTVASCERYFARSSYVVRGGTLKLASRDVLVYENPQRIGDPSCKEFLARVGGGHAEESGELTDLVGKIGHIMASNAKTDRQKREEMRVLQRNAPEELFTTAVRFVPVYADGKLQTFDSFMRKQTRGRRNNDLMKDPVGAGMSIVFNPKTDNIADKLGADDRVRSMVKKFRLNPFDKKK